MDWCTADLCDNFSDELQIAQPLFQAYGGAPSFHGPAATVKVLEDNSLVREAFESPGLGRVLVVDGAGSLRCALVGDMLAKLAIDNGWAGAIVNAPIRDSKVIGQMPIGFRALGTCPLKSVKLGAGEKELPVKFAGVSIKPGDWVYADEDGIVIASRELPL
jgi:regulator of ribonuclease activity A